MTAGLGSKRIYASRARRSAFVPRSAIKIDFTWSRNVKTAVFEKFEKMTRKCRFDPLDDMLALLTIDERIPRSLLRLGINRQVVYVFI